MLSRASVWTMKVGCSCDSSSVTKVYLSLHGYSLVELVLVICYRAVVNSCALNDLWGNCVQLTFCPQFCKSTFFVLLSGMNDSMNTRLNWCVSGKARVYAIPD